MKINMPKVIVNVYTVFTCMVLNKYSTHCTTGKSIVRLI